MDKKFTSKRTVTRIGIAGIAASLTTLIASPAFADTKKRNNNGNSGQQTITCNSNDYKYRFCRVDGNVNRVRLTYKDSSASCDLGYDWGYSRNGIWTKNGCRGTFVATLGNGNGRTGYDSPRNRPNDYDRGYNDRRYGDRGYGDRRYGDYGYGDRRYGDRRYGSSVSRRTAVDCCVQEAQRRLRRNGYGYASLQNVSRASRSHGEWRMELDFYIRNDRRDRHRSGRHRDDGYYVTYRCATNGYDVSLRQARNHNRY